MSDFHQDGDQAALPRQEKGGKRRTVGIRFAAAGAIAEYTAHAGLTVGPLLRPHRAARSDDLADPGMDEVTMWRTIESYLMRPAGPAIDVQATECIAKTECLYTPHSLRATTATLWLDAGVDITKVQALLRHRHLTTTQIYDKRRRSTPESA